MAELHDSHRWVDRLVDGVTVAVCVGCQAEGWDDEPDGFLPCPKPKKQPQRATCPATLKSRDTPGHVHECIGGHPPENLHFCRGCRRWFGVS